MSVRILRTRVTFTCTATLPQPSHYNTHNMEPLPLDFTDAIHSTAVSIIKKIPASNQEDCVCNGSSTRPTDGPWRQPCCGYANSAQLNVLSSWSHEILHVSLLFRFALKFMSSPQQSTWLQLPSHSNRGAVQTLLLRPTPVIVKDSTSSRAHLKLSAEKTPRQLSSNSEWAVIPTR